MSKKHSASRSRRKSAKKHWTADDICKGVIRHCRGKVALLGKPPTRNNAARLFLGEPLVSGIIRSAMGDDALYFRFKAAVFDSWFKTYGAIMAPAFRLHKDRRESSVLGVEARQKRSKKLDSRIQEKAREYERLHKPRWNWASTMAKSLGVTPTRVRLTLNPRPKRN